MMRLFLILLVALFTMGQTSISIDPATEKVVEDGRLLIDEYRKAHTDMYKNNAGEQDRQIQSDIQSTMMDGLTKLGFNPDMFKVIESFFDKSDTLNANILGYKDAEEFEEKATISDRAALSTMWK